MALAQHGRQLDDGVALNSVAQRVQKLPSQRTRARAKLPHLVAVAAVERLTHLLGQGRAKQRRQLGRGDEVAATLGQAAELTVASGVVAHARRVQRHRHEAVKRQPAPAARDGTAYQPLQGRRYTQRFGIFFNFLHPCIVENMSSRPVVLVTGAAKRVGREIALHLAASGFDVAVHYRGSKADALATVGDAQALGASAAAFQADLADEAACRALLPAVVAHFKRIDAVVNNASSFEYDTAATFSYAAMDMHFRANTGPAVLLAQALHDHLKGCIEVGCVVNILDQKLWNPNPDYLSYTLSKAALQSATVLLAQALAPQIRVCGVAPGVTLVSGAMTAAEFEKSHALTPLHRSSTPLDVAKAVRFLIDSPAITGTTLLVDGGQHLQAQSRDVMFIANPEK